MHAARSGAIVTPYTLLGVTATSNPEEIRAAYKKRALETHPDKGGDPEEFLRVKQAYEAITSGKASLLGGPPCRPPRFNPDMADPTHGVPLSGILKRKRNPLSMEEELSSGFCSIPGGPTAKRVAERMAAGDGVQARQSSSLSARVSMQAQAKTKVPAEVSVVKLWEKLTKLSPNDRTTAIANLDAGLRQNLSKHLAAKKNTRGPDSAGAGMPAMFQARPSPSPEAARSAGAGIPGMFQARPSPTPEAARRIEKTQPGSESDSEESSSSESSGSSGSSNEKDVGGPARRAVVTGQKPAQRIVGKSSSEVG